MNQYAAIIVLFFIWFASCFAQEYELNGAWAYREAYDYWKTGEAEEISATPVNIGDTTFLALTNSIRIVTKGEEKYFRSIAGGRFPIKNIIKQNDSVYILELVSSWNEEGKGAIEVHFVEKDLIYFIEGSMNEEFQCQYVETWLSTGEENLYKRCDIVSPDMTNYKTTHHTTDNLRLRDNSNTSSGIVTTLRKGSAVQVLETGAMQTIDGITAPWVKVLSESGYTGWCFSGYLKAK